MQKSLKNIVKLQFYIKIEYTYWNSNFNLIMLRKDILSMLETFYKTHKQTKKQEYQPKIETDVLDSLVLSMLGVVCRFSPADVVYPCANDVWFCSVLSFSIKVEQLINIFFTYLNLPTIITR